MAFTWSNKVKKGGEEWTPLPEEIIVKAPLNGRHDIPDLEPLITSILELGQLQPVTIRREDGMPVLFAGFNRWRAITTINKEGRTGPMRPDAAVPMRVRAVARNIGEEEGFFANIAENNVRTPTTPLDDAYNLKRLIDGYGLSEEEAAGKYGKDARWVRKTLELVQLSKPAQKAFREGRLLGPQAKKLAKLSKENQDSAVSKQGKITMSDVRAATGDKAKTKKEPPAATALQFGDDLARHVIKDDLTFEKLEALAKKYLELRGIEL